MCGRYQFSADEYKEIRQIVRDAQRRSEGNELNFPMAGDICPSQVAPVLVSRGEKIVGEFQQWGLPGFLGRQQIINARAETVNGIRSWMGATESLGAVVRMIKQFTPLILS